MLRFIRSSSGPPEFREGAACGQKLYVHVACTMQQLTIHVVRGHHWRCAVPKVCSDVLRAPV